MAENCKECLYYTPHCNILRGYCLSEAFNLYQYDKECPGFTDKTTTLDKLNDVIEDVSSMIGPPPPPRKIYKIGEKVTILKNGLNGIIENIRDGLYWVEYKLHNIEEWYNSNELTPVLCEKSMWIARDEDDSLWIFSDEPTLDGNTWTLKYDGKNTMNQLTSTLFPEVTFENSPKKVEIKIW